MTMVVVCSICFWFWEGKRRIWSWRWNIVTLTFVATHLHNEPIDKCTFCFDVSVEQKNYLTCWNCRSYSSLGSLILAKDDITRKEIVDKLFVISFRTRFASFLGGKSWTFRRQVEERLNDGTVGSRVRVPFLLYLFPLPSVKKVTFHSSTK